jgi:ParB-like chromosome segregation protein Spo0J
MLKRHSLEIAKIHVPVKRRTTLDPAKVATISESILADGLKMPIQVREDGARFVLVEGLHRLEAARTLGETNIDAYLVQAHKF